jgi:hypothetical protein
MPDERADVYAALEHCKFLISKGRGAESAKLILPKIEAQKRKAIDRYISLAIDPNVAFSIMLRLLQQLPDDSIRRLAKDETPTSQNL